MRAMVTGGAGFIGSNLVDALLDRGAEVAVLDDLSSGRRENLEGALGQGARLIEGSIAEGDFLAAQIADFAPQRIFHLAAQIDVRRAVADPAFDATVNILGTINVLEAVRRLPECGVVFASTGGAIYGEGAGRELPFGEDAEAAPEAAYGASKLAAEGYLGLYRRLYGLPAVALRFGNVYGPRQDPHGEAGVVAIFCGLLGDRQPLKVFGDGEQTRDYVYVDDVVAALLATGESTTERMSELRLAYNVGTGIETSVITLATELAKACGVEPELDFQPARAGEVQRVSIDAGALRRDLGWAPGFGLADGLRSTAEWFGVASPAKRD